MVYLVYRWRGKPGGGGVGPTLVKIIRLLSNNFFIFSRDDGRLFYYEFFFLSCTDRYTSSSPSWC